MRKFIIRNFLLTKKKDLVLGITNLMLFSIASLLITYTGFNIITVVASIASLLLLFFTFIYFDIYPVKWEELNDEQKWNVGIAVQTGKTTMKLTDKQLEEWKKLDKIFGSL